MTYEFLNWQVTAEYTGSKMADWGITKNWNHHTVTVKNTQNGKWTCFDFWASIAHPRVTSRYDTLNAFRCFVEDAISGDMDYKEFCAEFGYDEYDTRAKKTWKACQRSAEKLHRIYDGDLYELANSMEEYA